MNITRRNFVGGLMGLVAAPYVIRNSGLLMPVKAHPIMHAREIPLELEAKYEGSWATGGLQILKGIGNFNSAELRKKFLTKKELEKVAFICRPGQIIEPHATGYSCWILDAQGNGERVLTF
jgi:hypothetical protein